MAEATPAVEARFRAMGSDCHVLLHGGSGDDLAFAAAEISRLEQLWSRFIEGSEISRLNAGDGRSLEVSRETLALLCRAVRAQRLTGGWFDPFMGREIVDLGYDRDFSLLTAPVPAGPDVKTHVLRMDDAGVHDDRRSADAWLGISLHPPTVRIPVGFDFDPGGMGKGFGADLVTRALMDRGVAGALVNLGGDIRCRGEHPGDGWRITIEDPLDWGSSLGEYVRILDGAVATSTPLRRQWVGADGRRHNHLMHPAMGLPVGEEVASVTVIAPSGWIAEALCKALLVGGPRIGQPLLEEHGAGAIVVTLDGSVLRL